MAGYESDSSAEVEYTETKTLLGYASKEPSGDTISRLGGRPEWLDPNKPPSAALARCSSCNDMMVLLLQLNGELPDNFPGHERRLYVFACRRLKCRRREGAVRAVRGVRVSGDAAARLRAEEEKRAEEERRRVEEVERKKAEKAEEKKGPGLGEALFGAKQLGGGTAANPFSAGGANPFSSSSKPAANPFSSSPSAQENKPEQPKDTSSLPQTFAQTLSLNNPTPPPPSSRAAAEPWPPESSLPKPYPTLYLVDVDYETLDPTPATIPSHARMDLDSSDGPSSSSSAKDEKEAFESSMDAAFQKFADRMAQNPEQVVRYEFRGQPLLYSRDDAVGKLLAGGTARMPRCGVCGAGRVFEMQLTPHAITELEAEELSLEGMDWGTVIVGVCEKDCQAYGLEDGEVGYVEEWAGVQWEELTK